MASVLEFSRFRAKTVLLVGSGSLAAALMRRLVEAGARVHWFSLDADIAEEIWLSRRPDRIEIALREPRVRDFEEAAAVIAAAGEPLDSEVAAQARALDRPVAVLGRPELSTFDIDDPDGGGPGDAQPWQSWLGTSVRRTASRSSSLGLPKARPEGSPASQRQARERLSDRLWRALGNSRHHA